MKPHLAGVNRIEATPALSDGDIILYQPFLGFSRADTIQNSRFENWKSHAVANTNELGIWGAQLNSPLTQMPDNLLIRGNIFSGSDEAVRFTHYFGAVIDSNTFLNQGSLAVYLDDYSGTITRNYFFSSSGTTAIRASGTVIADSTTIAENVIEGYYARGHVFIWSHNPPVDGFRIRENKFLTGHGTPPSPYGLLTNISGQGFADYRLMARNNIFSQFDSAAIFSFSAFPSLQGDDFGNAGAGSPGNNVFLLPCNRSARAIKRVGGMTIPAEGNWYARDTITNADSANMFEGGVDFRPYLKVPFIPFFGKLGCTSTWAAGNYTLEGDFILDSCATLTLSPGAKVLALANQDLLRSGWDTTKTELIVKGRLIAVGDQTTASDSIIFTSASTSPAAGDWGGILVSNNGKASFDFCRVSYANVAISSRGDSVRVRDCTFDHFKGFAFYATTTKLDLGKVTLLPCCCGLNSILMKTSLSTGAKAVDYGGTGTLYAQGNWWDSTPPPSSWFIGSVNTNYYLHGTASPDSCGNGLKPPPKLIANLPSEFGLGQNYPNPFNPNTSIRYALPQAAHVVLEVFNILGQKVRTLVDEEQGVGFYQVLWDGTDQRGRAVSTGTYLYRIRAGDFVETKKMQLVK